LVCDEDAAAERCGWSIDGSPADIGGCCVFSVVYFQRRRLGVQRKNGRCWSVLGQ